MFELKLKIFLFFLCVIPNFQTEAENAEKNSTSKKKIPTLGMIGKSTSADNKFSRESLTRGGSQDDPVKLMRDLQDSIEREADLREQLKFAEEEVSLIVFFKFYYKTSRLTQFIRHNYDGYTI